MAALYIVLESDGDFSEISRNNPSIRQHKYYKVGVEFPSDISDLLPPREGRWWEHLGESALTNYLFLFLTILAQLPNLAQGKNPPPPWLVPRFRR
jgi:hypothetical protein